MFTWIIESTAPILAINGSEFTVQNMFLEPVEIGQSIAHDGACMTVTGITDETYTFFAMEESLKKTNFWRKRVGDLFNVERCLQIGDRLDGHFVTGHIETMAEIEHIQIHDDGSRTIQISYNELYDQLVVDKWSIAINGVSLTVVEVTTGWCTIWLIPHTLAATNLWKLELGWIVNVEFDLLAKYAQKKA